MIPVPSVAFDSPVRTVPVRAARVVHAVGRSEQFGDLTGSAVRPVRFGSVNLSEHWSFPYTCICWTHLVNISLNTYWPVNLLAPIVGLLASVLLRTFLLISHRQ